MFQRILVPLDGSRRAERAIPVAARLARISGGTVFLLRAVSFPPEFVSYVAFEPIAIEPIMNIEFAKAQTYLDGIAQTSALSGIPVEKEAILGQPAPTILSALDENHSDLIMMCSHGYTGMTRWMLGSVAEKVARLSPVPVVVLREEGPDLANPALVSLQALIPLDGSERAEAAIAPAGQLVAALSTSGQGVLHLLRVVVMPGEELNGHGDRAGIIQAAVDYLKNTVESIHSGRLASALADLGLSVTWSVTADGDIAAGIARVAESGESAISAEIIGDADSLQPSQLIAMATHGYGGLQLLTMGSVTGRTLLATRLPLLIVRPPDMKDKRAAELEAEARK